MSLSETIEWYDSCLGQIWISLFKSHCLYILLKDIKTWLLIWVWHLYIIIVVCSNFTLVWHTAKQKKSVVPVFPMGKAYRATQKINFQDAIFCLFTLMWNENISLHVIAIFLWLHKYYGPWRLLFIEEILIPIKHLFSFPPLNLVRGKSRIKCFSWNLYDNY